METVRTFLKRKISGMVWQILHDDAKRSTVPLYNDTVHLGSIGMGRVIR